MQVKTFVQALQECQNTKMKKIHLGNQKFQPSTGRPNCQNQAVWPACVRWELVIPQMNFFHFGVLAFLQGLYKCFHQNFPSNFFFTLCILQTYGDICTNWKKLYQVFFDIPQMQLPQPFNQFYKAKYCFNAFICILWHLI